MQIFTGACVVLRLHQLKITLFQNEVIRNVCLHTYLNFKYHRLKSSEHKFFRTAAIRIQFLLHFQFAIHHAPMTWIRADQRIRARLCGSDEPQPASGVWRG